MISFRPALAWPLYLIASGFVAYRATTATDDLSKYFVQKQAEFTAAGIQLTPEQKHRLTSLLVVQGCMYAFQGVRERNPNARYQSCGDIGSFSIGLRDNFIDLILEVDTKVDGNKTPFLVAMTNNLSAPNVDEFSVLDVKVRSNVE